MHQGSIHNLGKGNSHVEFSAEQSPHKSNPECFNFIQGNKCTISDCNPPRDKFPNDYLVLRGHLGVLKHHRATLTSMSVY